MEEQKKRKQYEFDKQKYDHVHLQILKGSKEEIKAHANIFDDSLNKFINRAIRETMERDNRTKEREQ